MIKFFNIYDQFIRKYPLSVQCLQTGILLGSGDALCQSIIEDFPILEFDTRRALEFFGIGALVIGPPKVLWLNALAKLKGRSELSLVLRKVVLDQILFAPFGLVLFLGSLGIVREKTPSEIKRIFRDDYPDILIANYKIWPAIQAVNFYLIPVQHQIVFIQSIAIIWNIYLSWKTHLKTTKI